MQAILAKVRKEAHFAQLNLFIGDDMTATKKYNERRK